jgi:DNA-binding winged helix-turn-helix (wHTH) protein
LAMRVRFGDFVLDADRRQLLRGSELVHLPPKALQLLEMLIERHPKAVSQKELYDLLWPDTFVEKSNLNNLVYQLREALDDQDHAIISTAYGFGFLFGRDVNRDVPLRRPPLWQLVIGDREFDLREGENIVGRESDAVVRIDSSSVSRRHARIILSGDRITLEDLGSKNGTSLRGKLIDMVHPLSDGDRIVFGTVAATVRAFRPTASTETAG